MSLEGDVVRFTTLAEEAGSTVLHVTGLAAVGPEVLRLAAGKRTVLAPGVAVRSPLPAVFTGVDGVDRSTGESLYADIDVGVAWAALGVAETGSTLLVEPDLADRAVSIFARHLIRVLRAESIVPSLAEALQVIAEMGAPGYASLVTGPSRTADIERSLTIGVQGPTADTVVVVT